MTLGMYVDDYKTWMRKNMNIDALGLFEHNRFDV